MTTAATPTDAELRDLFARHCECRPLDLEREEGDHAAIHDCDTEILHDVQVALGIELFNDVGRVQAMREARERCVEHIRRDDARARAAGVHPARLEPHEGPDECAICGTAPGQQHHLAAHEG